jgi:putative ABC transport system permease protein
MNVLALAARNLLRNRRRSLATLLALAIGAAAILLFGGFARNIEYSMQTAYVRTGGHLQIQHRDFLDFGSGDPTAYGIADYDRVIAAIRADPALQKALSVVTPILQFDGIAGNYAANVSRTIVGLGVVAEDHVRLRDWNDFALSLDAQPYPLAGTRPDAAYVGIGVARVLQLCVPLKIAECGGERPEAAPVKKGDGGTGAALPDDIAQLSMAEAASRPPPPAGGSRIELLASSARGTPNVASVEVVRAERQPFKEFDQVYVGLHLQQAQRLIYGSAPPRATAIILQLDHTRDVEAVQAHLGEMLAGTFPNLHLAVRDFETLNPFYVESLRLFSTLFGFTYCLIASIVLFTVSNTMNMAVVERTVEVGTLRAMGVRRGGIRRLFMVEGSMLGLAGALLGVVSALVASSIINRSGLTWLPPGSAYHLPLTLRVWGEVRMMLGTGLGLVAIATLSAWWPARRAARMIVVDALRHA